MPTSIRPGLIALHGNQLEAITDTFFAWMKRHPLGPLDEEVLLTPTHAVAEWLKIRLARTEGVCAAVSINLPGKVIWGLYRTILNDPAVPTYSATDKEVLVWRLMKMLPTEIQRDSYALMQEYLSRFGDEALFKLASQIAELFDQYQVYRADWLKKWEEGDDELIDPRGQVSPLQDQEIWQSECWRSIVNELNEQEQLGIRPHLHARVMGLLSRGEFDASALPKRIALLGVSSLPMQSLAFLAALSQYTQVLIGVISPCRFHWADIMEGREYFKWSRKRFKNRAELDLSMVDLHEMHLYANPILSAWGRQSRDFVRQLDEFDDVQKTKEEFNELKLDVFDHQTDPLSEASGSLEHALLHLIQNQVRDLEPMDSTSLKEKERSMEATLESKRAPSEVVSLANSSLVFHKTHGLTRELEVLHDQLLTLFDASNHAVDVQAYDVLVLMPDLELATPVIQAIFGQYDKSDPRHVPYAIAQQSTFGNHPLIENLRWLMNLGTSRCHLSDLLSVLKTPCVASRFDLVDNDFEQLEHWLAGSGMRWGLHGEQREKLGFSDTKEFNTVLFGIKRMLLGYTNADQSQLQEFVVHPSILPFDAISGLDAELVGRFVSFVEVICTWWEDGQGMQSPQEWVRSLRGLISELIKAKTPDDVKLLEALHASLNQFQEITAFANFHEPISLKVAGTVWLDALQSKDKRQRLLSYGVTFGSIKTMHSLPFKVVCLLSMNDGDFPRLSSHHPFDLMAQRGQARVGDRSKSSDDRGLMLQALLCAREKLYISWSAFNERDNSSKNPSVLVTQLRQYIAEKWSEELLDSITTTHPMQPFGAEYFKKDTKLFTYANEWLSIHEKTGIQKELLQKPRNKALKITGAVKEDVCSLQKIIQCIKNPVKHFFRTGLSIDFYAIDQHPWDDELFGLDALQTFKIKDELLELFKKTNDKKADMESLVRQHVSNLKLAGSLPLGPMGELLQESLIAEIVPQLNRALALQINHPEQLSDLILNFKFGELTAHESISGLRATEPSQGHQARVCLELIANRLFSNKAMRHHQLLRPWILSTVFAHLELDVQLVFLFADVQFTAVQQSKEQADHVLEVLASLYAMSEIQFVAVPLKTALTYAKNADLKKAKLIYEGSEHVFAEVNDLSLQRIFPDFEALIQEEGTLELWRTVFEPFWAWLDLQDKPESYSTHLELAEGSIK